MTVTMWPQYLNVAGALVGVTYLIECLVSNANPGRPQFLWQPVAANEEVTRLDAKTLNIERGPCMVLAACTDRMDVIAACFVIKKRDSSKKTRNYTNQPPL